MVKVRIVHVICTLPTRLKAISPPGQGASQGEYRNRVGGDMLVLQ